MSLECIDIDKIIDEATIEEKLSLTAGHDFWRTTALPRFHVPSITCSDGPNGIRGSRFFNSVPALCIPCGSGLGATWNVSLLQEAGELLSAECKAKSAHVWLGPTVNIHRSPLNGRGFESFSEDPYLSGMLAAAIIRGVQSQGTIAALKHFVANDQETDKWAVNVRISDRALREIYLMPFQLAIRFGKPGIVMTAYNKVQGLHCSENPVLLKSILREEWGFNGLVISDWFGTYSADAAFSAGLDLEMPGPSRYRKNVALAAISSGKLHIGDVNAAVTHVLETVKKASSTTVSCEEKIRNTPADRALNRRLAVESIVLLKNENNVLPLSVDYGTLAVIGPNSKLAAACGGGSASLRPYYTTSAYEGILSHVDAGTKVQYETGVYGHVLLPLLNTSNLVCVENKDGRVTIEFFNQPPSICGRQSFHRTSISETSYQLMDFHHPEANETFYISMYAQFVPEKSGVFEFGLASYGTSKLYINDELVIDNESSQDHGGMFFGHGSTERRATFEMRTNSVYFIRVEAGSANTSPLARSDAANLPGGACRLGCCLKIDPAEGIKRAVQLARMCRNTIIVAGLNNDYEKEGKDRQSMDMPPGVDDLIVAVLEAQPNAVIVTQAGTPITMKWRHKARAILHAWYGGNEGGNGIADVIFGKESPSGKLPMTFPDQLEDTPSYLTFGSNNGTADYSEGIFVGYRYYEACRRAVAFPFGHGLSYTTFDIRNLVVNPTEVRLTIKNTGMMRGAEVVQIYISTFTDSCKRCPRELKGFKKAFLEPEEQQTIEIPLDKYSTAFWDERRSTWVCEKGTYTVWVVAGPVTLKGTFELVRTKYWKGL